MGYTNTLKLSDTLAPTYDIGVIHYGYIGSGHSFDRNGIGYDGKNGLDFNEVYGKLTFANSLLKGDALSVGVNYSDDYWANSKQFWYFNVGYSAPIADTGFTGLASVGYNKFKNKEALAVVGGGPGKDDSYIDYKVGVNYNILGIVAELDVVGTDISTSGMTDAQKKPYDTGLVFSLTKTF